MEDLTIRKGIFAMGFLIIIIDFFMVMGVSDGLSLIDTANKDIASSEADIEVQQQNIADAYPILSNHTKAFAYGWIEEGTPDPLELYGADHDQFAAALAQVSQAESKISESSIVISNASSTINLTVPSIIVNGIFNIILTVIGCGLLVYSIYWIILDNKLR